MSETPLFTLSVASSIAETPHSTFVTGEATSHDAVAVVPGIGDGLGRVVGATAVFRIQSYSSATTFDTLGSALPFSFSTTSLDVAAEAAFAPSDDAPDFEPMSVSHFQAGVPMPMSAGIGAALNQLYQQSAEVPLEDLRDRHVEDGFAVEVEAVSLATPYVNGIPNVTGVFGSLLSDVVVTYEVEPRLYGGRDDSVTGDGASDLASLGGGDDRFRGEGGHDVARGGDGKDTLEGGSGHDGLYGGGGRDKLKGQGGDDRLFGEKGRDVLKGGGGDDELHGGGGKDKLKGGGGDDILDGGAGDDTLSGGGGDDSLTGGAGADLFDFRKPAGTDVVEDFEVGVDAILLTVDLAEGLRALAGITGQDVGFKDDDVEVPYQVDFIGVTALDDVIAAIVIG
jgi:hypothetical protein